MHHPFPLPAHVFVVVGDCGGRKCTISIAELAISRAFERSLKPDQTRLPVRRVRVFRGYKSLYPYPYPRKPVAKPVPFTSDRADFDNLVRVHVAPKQRDISSYTQIILAWISMSHGIQQG